MMSFFSFFGCKGSAPRVEKIEYEGFTIVRRTIYSSRYDINTASRRDDSRSSYQVYYGDQKIDLPTSSSQNDPKIWKVFVLEDAPRPSLIVANQSIYLISLDEGKMNINKLAGVASGFAKLQWLGDSNTSVGDSFEIYYSDDTEKEIGFFGGKYLMIHDQGVLDVSALSYHPFQEKIAYVNGFSTYNVVALSPDEKNLVFMGHNYNGQDHYALIIHNYHTGTVGLVPFDRNDTRLHEPYESDSEWLNTYFSWEKDEETGISLKLKKWDQLPPWTGHFTRDKAYSIRPVNKKMLTIFIDFLIENGYTSESEIQPDLTGMEDSFEINKDGCRIGLIFLERINSVYLSPHFTEKKLKQATAMITQFGKAFNEELRKGIHQDLFYSY